VFLQTRNGRRLLLETKKGVDEVSPANLLNLESLTRCFPVRSVRKILKETGRESIRERDLPL
jgi:hypothetical protein